MGVSYRLTRQQTWRRLQLAAGARAFHVMSFFPSIPLWSTVLREDMHQPLHHLPTFKVDPGDCQGIHRAYLRQLDGNATNSLNCRYSWAAGLPLSPTYCNCDCFPSGTKCSPTPARMRPCLHDWLSRWRFTIIADLRSPDCIIVSDLDNMEVGSL